MEFFVKICVNCKPSKYFCKKSPREMFDKVLYTPLKKHCWICFVRKKIFSLLIVEPSTLMILLGNSFVIIFYLFFFKCGSDSLDLEWSVHCLKKIIIIYSLCNFLSYACEGYAGLNEVKCNMHIYLKIWKWNFET